MDDVINSGVMACVYVYTTVYIQGVPYGLETFCFLIMEVLGKLGLKNSQRMTPLKVYSLTLKTKCS